MLSDLSRNFLRASERMSACWLVGSSWLPTFDSDVVGASKGTRYAIRLDWFAFNIIVSGRAFEGIVGGFSWLRRGGRF